MADALADLISIPEAASEFGLSRATLYRLLRQDKLRRYRRAAGRLRTYVDRAEVRRLTKVRPVR
jgi:excisionase family DNA binding protein